MWRYEVDCLIKEKYSEEAIAQAIRRSLRGDAGKVAMRLGPEAKIKDILDKMGSTSRSLERGEKNLEGSIVVPRGKMRKVWPGVVA